MAILDVPQTEEIISSIPLSSIQESRGGKEKKKVVCGQIETIFEECWKNPTH